jgi:hypothetical protein
MAFEYDPIIPFEFDPECNRPDYHAVVSIQLCELIDAGFFDLTRVDWDFGPKYSAEQHAQLCKKITDHYYYREIALTPPGVWKREFLRKMNEIMPKYMAWYKLVNDDDFAFGVTSEYTDTGDKYKDDEYYKGRNIFSDFPQTALAGNNSDYASTGNDTEYERIREGNRDRNISSSKHADPLELIDNITRFDDIDATIIKEIEPLFSCMFTVNINGF